MIFLDIAMIKSIVYPAGDLLTDDVRSFQNLIQSTHDVAAWLIAWNIVIIVVLTVSIVLAVYNIKSKIVGIIVCTFLSVYNYTLSSSLSHSHRKYALVPLQFLLTLQLALNAAAWGEPPALCVPQNDFTKDKDVSCDTLYIGITCVVALQAVSPRFLNNVATMFVSV